MTSEAVLVYHRVNANRRKTVLLLLTLSILAAPFVFHITEYLMLWVALLAPGIMQTAIEDPVRGMAYAAAGAVAVSLGVVVLLYGSAAYRLLRVKGARPVSPQEEPELWRAVGNLCIGAGLPAPAVHVMEAASANAFSTGFRPDGATLVVTRGLLDLADRRELEGVIAHELSHMGNHDIQLGMALTTAVSTLWLPIRLIVGLFSVLFRIHWLVGGFVAFWLSAMAFALLAASLSLLADDPSAGVWLFLVYGFVLYCVVGAPVAGLLIRVGTSRSRELLADADAALLTRLPHRLASILEKMSEAQTEPLKVSRAMAHLFIVDPSLRKRGWLRDLLSPHPPMAERVAILRAMGTPDVVEPTTDGAPGGR